MDNNFIDSMFGYRKNFYSPKGFKIFFYFLYLRSLHSYYFVLFSNFVFSRTVSDGCPQAGVSVWGCSSWLVAFLFCWSNQCYAPWAMIYVLSLLISFSVFLLSLSCTVSNGLLPLADCATFPKNNNLPTLSSRISDSSEVT